ncbi:uncharacterized protein Dvar_78220 [Desulfosarcina variabilis str. Montpellier]|uniref:hypothetical protein n=1 Tax=Desulfosarcina variabilis TaxID=2300 RepID=UPI003AFABBF1
MKQFCRFVCCSLILFSSTHCYAIDFFLVNASSDNTIEQLQTGDSINLQQVGSNLNIRAEVTQNVAQETVRFELDGEDFNTERGAPYALAGDDGNGDYYSWTPDAGTHTLTAVALDGSSNILAQSTITFFVSTTSVDNQFDKSRGDLISLHYDHRADPDDGHSAAADLTLIDYYGLGSNVHVVSGTYGYNSEEPYENSDDYHEFYQEESEDVMIAAWGADWLNAHILYTDDGLNPAVSTTASIWASTLGNAAHIWIKEGGPSDFTAEVLKLLHTDHAITVATTKARVHLVQHGPTDGREGFNERHTIDSNLEFVKENTDYLIIANGNEINDTAGLVIMRDDTNGIDDIEDFMDSAKAHTTCGGAWFAAFNYYNPLDNNGAEEYWPWDSRLDFSDTVELLYILNIGKETVADCNDFAKAYLPSACPAFVPGPDACTSDCPCGEGEGDCDSDADCEAGLTCVEDVGADYGWPASRDVCEAASACPAFVPGPDACTISCPCGEGEGDCDSDAECEAGLTCVQGVGAEYGWPAGRDVCQ